MNFSLKSWGAATNQKQPVVVRLRCIIIDISDQINDIEFKCLIDSKFDALCVAFLTVKLDGKESRKR